MRCYFLNGYGVSQQKGRVFGIPLFLVSMDVTQMARTLTPQLIIHHP